MRRLRITILILLWAAPFVFLIGMGWYALWERGWSFWAWWPITGSIALGSMLAVYWYRKHGLIRPLPFAPPPHAADRDREAWKLVETHAAAVGQWKPEQLTAPLFYLETAQKLSTELARFYQPHTSDPVGAVTLQEILAVIELAAHDLAELLDQYVPAGHLITIDQWRKARRATDWYQSASQLYWLAAAIWSPLETGAKYAASQAGVSRPWQLIQQNLLGWFYSAYLNRLGHYLIELYSGRLRVGATRYRELAGSGSAPRSAAIGQVTVALLGQVKAGKSSVINALLGAQRATTNAVPETAGITRYELAVEDEPTRLVLLDTPGYGHEGPREDHLRETLDAARRAHLILLVLHARTAARQADAAALRAVEQWFHEHPELKMPPVVVAVTHIDLLTPMMEWSPPYDWQEPRRPKEVQIAEAVAAAHETLGPRVNYAAPVCTAEGKVYGVDEWLLPALLSQLDEARGVELVRCLRAEADQGKVRKVFQQLFAAGKEAVNLMRQRAADRAPPRP